MRTTTIRPDDSGRINFLIQDTPGDRGRHTMIRRSSKAASVFNWLPAAPYTLDETHGGCVAAGIVGNRLMDVLIKKLQLQKEVRKLKEGSYLIRTFKHKNAASLLILGSDLLGFHYALSDAGRGFSMTDRGLACSGGDKTEIPAFKLRAFWDTDTRTRWNADCKYPVSHCCLLDYPESTEIFIDNFKRVVDGMVDYRRNVLTIWGFVRDEHGGVEATQEVVHYARQHGIDVVPGIGTHFYGGPYYRGNHPFNLDTYIQTHKKRMKSCSYGVLRPCPTDPKNIAWLLDGVHWLFETFDIQGVSLENGDYFNCQCPTCRLEKQKMRTKNPTFYKTQCLSYLPVLQEVRKIKKCKWSVYATYTGFSPLFLSGVDPYDPSFTQDEREKILEDVRMGRDPRVKEKALVETPAFAKRFPPESTAQWNVSGQLRRLIPLKAFLDDGNPKEIYAGPLWPKSMRSPVKNNVFYDTDSLSGKLCLSGIKELAVRVHQGKFDGTVDYGERSPREVSVDINYLAQSHFAYHPNDSLRDFAREQLSDRVGGPKQADKFIELLCKKDSGPLTKKEEEHIWWQCHSFEQAMIHTNATTEHPANYSVDHFDNWTPHCFWKWLREYTTPHRGKD